MDKLNLDRILKITQSALSQAIFMPLERCDIEQNNIVRFDISLQIFLFFQGGISLFNISRNTLETLRLGYSLNKQCFCFISFIFTFKSYHKTICKYSRQSYSTNHNTPKIKDRIRISNLGTTILPKFQCNHLEAVCESKYWFYGSWYIIKKQNMTKVKANDTQDKLKAYKTRRKQDPQYQPEKYSDDMGRPIKRERTAYRWLQCEQKRYVNFLITKRRLFELSIQQRKVTGVHTKMSKIIKTKSSSQCRSHHQKMLVKFGTINKILQHFINLVTVKNTLVFNAYKQQHPSPEVKIQEALGVKEQQISEPIIDAQENNSSENDVKEEDISQQESSSIVNKDEDIVKVEEKPQVQNYGLPANNIPPWNPYYAPYPPNYMYPVPNFWPY